MRLIFCFQYYDPRVWVREGEKTLTERVKEACTDLGNVGELTSSIDPTHCDTDVTCVTQDRL